MTMNNPYPQVQESAPRLTKNGIGTAGFVVGLIGLIFAPVPLIGVIAWPLVIVGLVLSVIGLNRARKGAPNKGLSIAGIVCSAIGLLLCIMWAAAFGQTANELAEGTAGGTNPVSQEVAGQQNAGQQDEGQQDEGQQDAATAGIGEPVSDGMFEFTVTEVETGIQHVGGEYVGTDAQGQFVVVHVTVHNTGDEPRMLSMSSQQLYDAQGRKFEASSGAAAMALPESDAFVNNINPGNSVDAQLLFDVPEDFQPGSIELHDSMMSGGVTVSLSGAGA